MSCSMESLYDAVRKETNKFHQWDTRMSVNLEARKQAFRNAEKILTENRATVIKARSATLELAREVNAERNKTIYEGKVCCGTEHLVQILWADKQQLQAKIDKLTESVGNVKMDCDVPDHIVRCVRDIKATKTSKLDAISKEAAVVDGQIKAIRHQFELEEGDLKKQMLGVAEAVGQAEADKKAAEKTLEIKTVQADQSMVAKIQYQESIEDLKNHVGNVQEANKSKVCILKEVQCHLKEYQDKVDWQKTTSQELTADNDAAQKAFELVTEQFKAAQQAYETEKSRLNSTNADKEDKEAQNGRLKLELDQLLKSKQDYQVVLDQVDEAKQKFTHCQQSLDVVTKVEEQNDQLRREGISLKSEAKALEVKMIHALGQAESYREKVAVESREKVEAESRLAAVQETSVELQKQLEHLSLANRDTDEELSDMNLELDKLKERLVEADQKRQVLSSQQAKMNDDDLDVPLQEAEKTLEHQEKILEKKTKAKEDLNKQMDRVKSEMAREFTRAIGIVHANLEKEKELRDQAQQVVSRMNFTIEQAEKRNKVEEEELINTPLFFQRGKRQFETPRVYGRKKHNAGCFSSSRFSLDDDDL